MKSIKSNAVASIYSTLQYGLALSPVDFNILRVPITGIDMILPFTARPARTGRVFKIPISFKYKRSSFEIGNLDLYPISCCLEYLILSDEKSSKHDGRQAQHGRRLIICSLDFPTQSGPGLVETSTQVVKSTLKGLEHKSKHVTPHFVCFVTGNERLNLFPSLKRCILTRYKNIIL